jgi:hypothetical protein
MTVFQISRQRLKGPRIIVATLVHFRAHLLHVLIQDLAEIEESRLIRLVERMVTPPLLT